MLTKTNIEQQNKKNQCNYSKYSIYYDILANLSDGSDEINTDVFWY